MKWDTIKHVMSYAIVTALISIIGQLDSMGFDFSKLNVSLCITMLLKSLLPGLVAVKALFDDTLVNSTPVTTNAEEQPKA